MNAYRTVARTGTAEVEVRRSRFLAVVTRVDDEAQARDVIASVRREHHDARHHCSAFVIGADASLRRSNDDGEPAGTAGAPMLEVLTRRDVSDVVAVVTRWFGGTLLGAGGLVRAYGDAVGLALDAAGTRQRRLLHTMRVTAPAAESGALDHRLRAMGEVSDVEYGTEVVFTVGVRDAARFAEDVAGASAGRATVEPSGTSWVDV
ncbi:YigZ family protein [Aeromicrobium sp. CFBP 8757]|uniref:IMPACT family protein n=1 Tax=Aeromicrobium sp. CFBP 8757 TaxID=2775288 RepID=UPI0017855BC6|nr:YigZ family protein [Aeromicrobium sp. CFBP 8757]MBD8608328.1 YigZ family protein [Aeromicrobium sp. CFBP 8757]